MHCLTSFWSFAHCLCSISKWSEKCWSCCLFLEFRLTYLFSWEPPIYLLFVISLISASRCLFGAMLSCFSCSFRVSLNWSKSCLFLLLASGAESCILECEIPINQCSAET